MAKRPRFSRWRRLPPVFRTGEHRPIGAGNELDRIILYLPTRLLDLAEVLAEKAGIPAVQDYCSHLLARAIEAEQVQRKVSGIEARRGALEGLREIAEDPGYLAEWQARSDLKPELPRPGANPQAASPPLPHAGETITVDLILADGDVTSMEPAGDEDSDEIGEGPSSEHRPGSNREPGDLGGGDDPVRVSIPTAPRPTIRVASDRPALEVLWRHVGTDGDDAGFLPGLRRGVPVSASKVSELLHALGQLEEEHRGATMLDRRMTHALHRLALESQVLLTDAWPGVFDDRMIAAIRSVQEAVERILSGQDIRYYSNPTQ
ncbi:MAG: hypothetical protein ACLQGP_30965 [Isosphaeraceae bacterium]